MSDVPERLKRKPYWLTDVERDLVVHAIDGAVNDAQSCVNEATYAHRIRTGKAAKIALTYIRGIFA